MKNTFLASMDHLHTTSMGKERILKNLKLSEATDVILYCKEVINNPLSSVILQGKNFYVFLEDITITINKHSYTIITAHKNMTKR